MSSEPKTSAQEVSAALSEALFKAGGSARGVFVAVALESGAVAFFGSGDFVTRMGLYHAIMERGHEDWEDGEDVPDE